MNDATGKKINFIDSRFSKFYSQEMYVLCYSIKTCLEDLFAQFPVDMRVLSGSTYKPFSLIYQVLSAASQIKEMFSESSKPFKKTKSPSAIAEQKRQVALHKDRAQYLKSILGSVSIDEIKNKKVRNSIEHFPAHLDLENELHTRVKCKEKYAIAFNFIVCSWAQITSTDYPKKVYQISKSFGLPMPIYPIRVYVISEMKFYNFEEIIDLGKILTEVNN